MVWGCGGGVGELWTPTGASSGGEPNRIRTRFGDGPKTQSLLKPGCAVRDFSPPTS